MDNEKLDKIIQILEKIHETQIKTLRLLSQYDTEYHTEIEKEGIVEVPR